MDLSRIVNGPLPDSGTTQRRSYRDQNASTRTSAALSRTISSPVVAASMRVDGESPYSRNDRPIKEPSRSYGTSSRMSVAGLMGKHDPPQGRTLPSKSIVEDSISEMSGKSCPTCNKTFYSSTHVEIHQNTVHKGIKKHKCPICPARFGQSGTLTRHVHTVHDKRRDHGCHEPGCGKRFSSAWSLKDHRKNVHQKLKPHICRISGCSKTFGNHYNRRKHERNIHGVHVESLNEYE